MLKTIRVSFQPKDIFFQNKKDSSVETEKENDIII